MSEKHCANCGQPFTPREAKVRFCCPECNREWWVAERSRAMAAWRERQEQPERSAAVIEGSL
jgi:predicted RNA-binding Zn-ribbon protein involved in translation (DUF1610 family)